ncbi:plastid lipid-associated protein/fibrillin conserved domain-containing protein [Artemisia annua]|uniref:Plastid lipid-associated protein/fibrillin conserved domain-containing protein n=1 Tax=Artemisia annua TaxID=35608 RepID=A0A2U1MW77_ARTAN|nr:plastid lipid-associated protein/fibrillin conserved domain-containing protein [Artemisia annua]
MGHLVSPLPLTPNCPLVHHSSCLVHSLVLHSSPITHISIKSLPTTSFASTHKANKKTRLWRTGVSFFQSFSTKSEDIESLKQELFEIIAPLDRGANASLEQQELVDQIARKLEAVNKVKEPLKSDLINGKWELLYTTSQSILQTKRPKILRANGKIYQAINVDTLRAQNMETWPFFNQATANLVPLNAKRVAVKFDAFKVFSLIPIKARGSGRGQLEITYLDEELRISRGNEGNLFILRMVDPTYRVPV